MNRRQLLVGGVILTLGLAVGSGLWQIAAQRPEGGIDNAPVAPEPSLPEPPPAASSPADRGGSRSDAVLPRGRQSADAEGPVVLDAGNIGPPTAESASAAALAGTRETSTTGQARRGVSADAQTGKSSVTAPPVRQEEQAEGASSSGARVTAATPTLLRRLPFGTRQAVGTLRLDAHVYDVDPGRRFVMINGKTLAAGDLVRADLGVQEIRREGVVLNWKGELFLLGISE
jgi:hypothetical protein